MRLPGGCSAVCWCAAPCVTLGGCPLRQLYVIRQDGVTAVLRPGGQSVIQHADGTRLTLTMPAPERDFSQDQVT